jgi:hypothetical protein
MQSAKWQARAIILQFAIPILQFAIFLPSFAAPRTMVKSRLSALFGLPDRQP